MIVSNGRSAASAKVIAPPPERVTSEEPSKPSLAERALEPAEVVGHPPAHERVDHRRRRALVLAVLAADLVRERDLARRSRPRAARCAARQLVLAVGVGVQEGDRDRRAALGLERLPRRRGRRRASIGVCTSPVANSRSRTGSRSRRGTSGSGWRQNRSYMSTRSPRRISSTSRKPSVASRPTTAPRRSSSALRPTVVPCRKNSAAPQALAPGRRRRPRAGCPARATAGVVGALATRVSPDASS